MKYLIQVLVLLTCLTLPAAAQHYNAIHGSDYSGSLGVYNNPSSIVNARYRWDVTVIGLQFQTITNAVKGPNFPFSLSRNVEYYAATGNYKRYADLNFNLHLFNTRIALGENGAIAFGANLRTGTILKTSQLNYNDSIAGPRTFLFYNENNGTLAVNALHSGWAEFFLAYARTVWNNETNRLNAGATLKIQKGLSGAFAEVSDIGITHETVGDQTEYRPTNGSGKYGYSNTLSDGDSFTANNLFSASRLGFAVDLGAEYIIKSQAVETVYDDSEAPDYDWKIGVSLLDLGFNNFAYSPESRRAGDFRDDVTAQTLTDKFSTVENAGSFNDTVATIVNVFEPLTGNFKIFNPARLVINVDKFLSGKFYLNSELSVNLLSGGANNYAIREPKLLTVTPRWESKRLGVYLPAQVTRYGNFWIGGAVKAGPLLLGTHNLLNIFSKNKYISGGAYLAITIRPSTIIRSNRLRQTECPEY